MARRRRQPASATQDSSTLVVRLDGESKQVLSRAAELRQISISDYVRMVTISQARKEVDAASQRVLALSPDEQQSFWSALHDPGMLTDAQKRLGAMMRGER